MSTAAAMPVWLSCLLVATLSDSVPCHSETGLRPAELVLSGCYGTGVQPGSDHRMDYTVHALPMYIQVLGLSVQPLVAVDFHRESMQGMCYEHSYHNTGVYSRLFKRSQRPQLAQRSTDKGQTVILWQSVPVRHWLLGSVSMHYYCLLGSINKGLNS
jgi:hypothetical protein